MMSGGKKKHPKKRMYGEAEIKRGIKQAADDATKRIMLLCLTAAVDVYGMDADKLNELMETMQRYINYEGKGLVSLADASKSLYNSTGIDLRLTRW